MDGLGIALYWLCVSAVETFSTVPPRRFARNSARLRESRPFAGFIGVEQQLCDLPANGVRARDAAVIVDPGNYLAADAHRGIRLVGWIVRQIGRLPIAHLEHLLLPADERLVGLFVRFGDLHGRQLDPERAE
jgi:hypothetical protein